MMVKVNTSIKLNPICFVLRTITAVFDMKQMIEDMQNTEGIRYLFVIKV